MMFINRKQIIRFSITNNCNYKCDFCGVYNKQNKQFSNFDQLKKVYNFLEKIINNDNNIEVIIYGGEPTLHPELINFINLFNNKNEICLTTNLHKDLNYFKNFIDKNINIECTFYINKVNYIDFFNKVKSIKEDLKIKIVVALTIYNQLYNDIELVNNIINYIKELNLINNVLVDTNSLYLSNINKNIKKLLLDNFSNVLNVENKNDYDNILNYKNFDCFKLFKNIIIDDDGWIFKCIELLNPYFINLFKMDLNQCLKIYNREIDKSSFCNNFNCCLKLGCSDIFKEKINYDQTNNKI